jgi:hypothetical protein
MIQVKAVRVFNYNDLVAEATESIGGWLVWRDPHGGIFSEEAIAALNRLVVGAGTGYAAFDGREFEDLIVAVEI